MDMYRLRELGIGLVIALVIMITAWRLLMAETSGHQTKLAQETKMIAVDEISEGDKNIIIFKTGVYARRISEIIKQAYLSIESQFTDMEGNSNNGNGRPVTSNTRKELCPSEPLYLQGKVVVDFHQTELLTIDDVIRDHPDITNNGEWTPPDCIARHRVAIIIPYRDRLHHLVILLDSIIRILKRQQLDFRIYVVEQYGDDIFNKGRIMNTAFKEAIRDYDFQCVVFHDVDMISEDDRNMYSCPSEPRHMSPLIDEMNYIPPYDGLVGGVLNMRSDHFQMVNGFSNEYWAWGAEDDDMTLRIHHVGLTINQPPFNIARYKMIRHKKRDPISWSKNYRLLRFGIRRINKDGLNTAKYAILSKEDKTLYTHITVEVIFESGQECDLQPCEYKYY